MGYKFLKKQKNAQITLKTKLAKKGKKLSSRKLLLNGLFLLMLLLSVYFFVWSGFWSIKHITISGTQKAGLMAELIGVIQNYKRGFYYKIIPKDNILFLDLEELSEAIKYHLLLDELSLTKKIPNRLLIYAKEKRPVIIWQDGSNYYYVDKHGKVISAIKIEQIEYDLPFVSSLESNQVIVGKEIIKPEQINYIRETVELVKKKFDDWYIDKIILPTMSGKDIFFYSNQGWYFILSLDSNKQAVLNNLDLLLKQKADKLKGVKYVDLRIEDRLFYK